MAVAYQYKGKTTRKRTLKQVTNVLKFKQDNSSAMSTVGLGLGLGLGYALALALALAYSIVWVASLANATTGVLACAKARAREV